MINQDMLRRRIAESGYKLQYLSERLGLSRPSLTAKIRGKSEFSVSEVQGLAQVLNLTYDEKEAIFFAPTVNCKLTKEGASQ